MAFVRGHALSMKAIHGGKAQHDTIDSHKIAALLRGGMLPPADVYPAEMRATRDLLRRRTHLLRQRSELLGHVQNTNSQYNPSEIDKKIASTANRDGVAERFDDPAGHKNIDVDLGLITSDDGLLTDRGLSIVKTAKPHDAHTFSRLHAIPGGGKILALVLLYDIMMFTASPACRISSRTAAWSHALGKPLANAMGPRARTSAPHTSSGPFQKRPCGSYAIIRQGSSIGPEWTTSMARAKR
jgi:hypothetical protein